MCENRGYSSSCGWGILIAGTDYCGQNPAVDSNLKMFCFRITTVFNLRVIRLLTRSLQTKKALRPSIVPDPHSQPGILTTAKSDFYEFQFEQ